MAVSDAGGGARRAGHSSVTTLRQLPFDRVKIDRSFVANGLDDAENAKIASAVLGLAHSLRLGTTAEGGESQRDLDWLLDAEREGPRRRARSTPPTSSTA